MPVSKFAESTVEQAMLEWVAELDFTVLHGPDTARGEPAAERVTYGDILLVDRPRDAMERLNPRIPADALEDAFRKVTRTETPSLAENNRRFHTMLIDGVDVEYHAEGRIVHDKAWLVDFDRPARNDWLAVNEFTVTQAKGARRPDVALFVNGIPLAVMNAGRVPLMER
jgi:type I restriction enzyme R subunit